MADNVLLTGQPGCGKTTVVRRTVEVLSGYRLAGFYTQEIRQRGNRVGFRAVGLRRASAILAHIAERFLSLRQIPGHYNTKGDSYDCSDSSWKIQGGGHWKLSEDTGTLRIFGWSQAYGGVDLEDLAAR
jgi:hypothetical protein